MPNDWALIAVRAPIRLRPTIPRGSQVLVSVASTGMLGVYQTLVANQALQAWYRDPGLVASTAEQRKAGFPADLLFRVRSTLDLVEIDPDTFEGWFNLRFAQQRMAAAQEPARSIA
jgi:hypothetical protein